MRGGVLADDAEGDDEEGNEEGGHEEGDGLLRWYALAGEVRFFADAG